MSRQRLFSHLPKPGITGKLFLAILAVCALTVLGMGLASRLSFQAGFFDYLVEIEEERVSALAVELIEEYRQAGGWEPLREPKTWRRLINRFVRVEPDKPPKAKPSKKTPGQPPPPPPAESAADRARRDWERAYLRSSIGLVSADRQHLLAGFAPGAKAAWTPLEVGGSTIGWLTREPLAGITDAVDVRFQDKQRTAFALIIVFTLILAAACALLLSRFLTAPLRRFSTAAGRLAAGDLTARVAGAPPRDSLLSFPSGKYDELQLLAAQINHLADVLEANESARRTFMAEIAHDLRTPLSILRGEIEALEDGVRPVTPGALASLRSEVELIGRLVDDIQTLSLADLGRLRYDKQRIDLAGCLASALAATRERMEARGLTLEAALPEQPVMIFADPVRITQVLRNVLENSLRYTNAGGRIVVRCAGEGGEACVDVYDSPPSVPEAQLPLLFERFHSGDPARNRARGGSGLGLAICRTLVDAHAGHINALPSPLGGVWIRICLPIMENV